MSTSVMFYVQHLMGIGHQRRMAAIARACASHALDVTYVSGGMPVHGLDVGPARFVQLPPCRSPDLGFDTLVDEHGAAVDEAWRQARLTALLEAWRSAAHGALVVETYPFGRKLMRFELEPLVDAARADGALRLSSIRDIIDYRPKRKKYEAMAAAALAGFDKVLVHSDPRLMPLDVSFPPHARIAHLVTYTGYVREHDEAAREADEATLPPPGEVVVSAGGGAYGVHLLDAAIHAAALRATDLPAWRVLVGQNVSAQQFAALADLAATVVAGHDELRIAVERARPDFQSLLRRAGVSVSQGGYNTVMDVLSASVPAVIVAYHDATEREQLIRARELAARGAVVLLPDAQLTPQALVRSVLHARQHPPAALELDVDGANTSAAILAGLLRARAGHGR